MYHVYIETETMGDMPVVIKSFICESRMEADRNYQLAKAFIRAKAGRLDDNGVTTKNYRDGSLLVSHRYFDYKTGQGYSANMDNFTAHHDPKTGFVRVELDNDEKVDLGYFFIDNYNKEHWI